MVWTLHAALWARRRRRGAASWVFVPPTRARFSLAAAPFSARRLLVGLHAHWSSTARGRCSSAALVGAANAAAAVRRRSSATPHLLWRGAAGASMNDLVLDVASRVGPPSIAGAKPPRRTSTPRPRSTVTCGSLAAPTTLLDDLWMYSPALAQWNKATPSGRRRRRAWGHAMATISPYLYVWGGCAARCTDTNVRL